MGQVWQYLAHEFQLPLANPIVIFMIILLIILLSPIFLKKFNIPGLIGLIIAGVFIGPDGLHIVDKSDAITLFSTIGLLYLMFMAGLDLDLDEFRSHRSKSLLFGFFTFIIPPLLGFPLCYYLLGYDVNASLLTSVMFSTHTLVAYPIVSKLGIAKNQVVAITVGGTILTDTAVLIILALVLGGNNGDLNVAFLTRLGISVMMFSVIMFWVIPRITIWFFRSFESEKHSHYIFVLVIVFFAAFLSEVSGLEPIIGAFVAGLSLNRLIPHTSALMNRIEFMGNSLFIPFFLISVGMHVDVSVIFSGPMAVTVALALTLVALLGKWAAAYFTQITLKYSPAQRNLIFGLSSSHAAATLAIILVGYEAGILDDNILNGTILLILITCVVASFVTERAAKTVLVEDENRSEALPVKLDHPEQILLPIANVENIEKLLEFAIFIKDKKSANPIAMLSVVSNNNEAEANIQIARKKLETFVKQGSAHETQVNIVATIDHNIPGGIARMSRETMTDFIVLGWPGKPGFLQRFIGDKVDGILTITDKTTFICHFARPITVFKKLVLVVPPLAEFEQGFDAWLSKISRLTIELNQSLVCYCNESTQRAIRLRESQRKGISKITFQPLDDWEMAVNGFSKWTDNELIILICARRGSVSYLHLMEDLPSKLEESIPNQSKLMIYP